MSKDLHEIVSKKLKDKYLSDSQKEYDGEINGIIHGVNLQLFCATTLKIRDKIKVVHYLVDTGSSMTYISEEVMKASSYFCKNKQQINIH
jgi:hypothetical protein